MSVCPVGRRLSPGSTAQSSLSGWAQRWGVWLGAGCRGGRAGRLISTVFSGRVLLDDGMGQAGSGGPVAAVSSCCHAGCQGQPVGRCSVRPPVPRAET
jgi:hypothetical protein